MTRVVCLTQMNIQYGEGTYHPHDTIYGAHRVIAVDAPYDNAIAMWVRLTHEARNIVGEYRDAVFMYSVDVDDSWISELGPMQSQGLYLTPDLREVIPYRFWTKPTANIIRHTELGAEIIPFLYLSSSQ